MWPREAEPPVCGQMSTLGEDAPLQVVDAASASMLGQTYVKPATMQAELEKRSALQALNPLMKAESQPILPQLHMLPSFGFLLQTWRPDFQNLPRNKKWFHNLLCFSKGLSTVTLALSYCSLNTVSELARQLQLSAQPWPKEGQVKVKQQPSLQDDPASSSSTRRSYRFITDDAWRMLKLHFNVL